MNDYLEKRINTGAYFQDPENKCWLIYARFDAPTRDLYCLYQPLSKKFLSECTLKITDWSIDEECDKLYAAYSARAYEQIKPVEFEKILEHRQALERHYLNLTNNQLPQSAIENNWSVRENHCFQRIILDHLFQRPWPEALPSKRKSAYRQLSNYQLGRAIGIAHRMTNEPEDYLQQLNERSLAYRKKWNSKER